MGADMTPDMIERSWGNARMAGAESVEFSLGEIEHLPVADNSNIVAVAEGLPPGDVMAAAKAVLCVRVRAVKG
jgi:ubiquinone/menaquinone biosynthesis C-methylase UbiE